jgi:hypothetical protein
MKLVPFFTTQKQTASHTIVCLTLFLGHAGKSIWKTEEPGLLSKLQILQDYCEPNGFVVESIWIDEANQIAYVEVNPKKTTLSDFYTWEEALARPEKPECWRPFYFIHDKEQSDWWSSTDIFEGELSEGGNIIELYKSIVGLRNQS